MIFDTHVHYDDEAFDEDRDILLQKLKEEGVDTVVNVSSSMETCRSTLRLAHENDFIYAAVGVHPSETTDLTQEDMQLVEEYCDDERVVAIGEIGLDYHWKDPEPEHQKKFFVRQLDIARKKDLPVIIHSRDAAADTMEILKAEHAEDYGGVIHCFSYSAEQALIYADMGFYIGVGGVLTFKNSRKLKETVEKLPMDRIVLETDCPYLAPEPNRGHRNSSLNLPYVVHAISDIKGIPEEDVMRITHDNAMKLYRMDRK